MGKLIVIEGTDGSGKATQTDMLCRHFEQLGRKVKRLEFPRYSEESSALVRLYLAGEFGSKPDSVNPYAASTFYAVDRFASYKQDWEKFYLEPDSLVITDRYTTSNAVHQAPKLPEDERDGFVSWLYDFEYRLMGLPDPDMVIYLDMPTYVTKKMMSARREKTESAGDIHESDEEYLNRCRDYTLRMAESWGWTVISCGTDDGPRSVGEIQQDILNAVGKI